METFWDTGGNRRTGIILIAYIILNMEKNSHVCYNLASNKFNWTEITSANY